jgi:ankyrin repeat protein
VDFAIEKIRKVDFSNMGTVLDTLPVSLAEMYAYILCNIAPNLASLVAGLLRWIVCAHRPLNVLELTVALKLSNNSGTPAENLVLDAVRACGNMLTVSSQDNTVNIVHRSVVDFLCDESSPVHQDPRLAPFIIRVPQVDSDITNFCIQYLEAGCCDESPIFSAGNEGLFKKQLLRYPFMTYAIQFWPDHLRDAGNYYTNFSSPFFQAGSKIRKNWWRMYWAFPTGKITLVAPVNFNLLHLASYFDLVCIARQVLKFGDLKSRLDKRCSHGITPLEYAVKHGHLRMFRLLIEVGASQKGTAETLLELACREGQRDMAACLIDIGYKVNFRAQSVTNTKAAYLNTKWLPSTISEGLDLNRDVWSLLFRDVGEQQTVLFQVATYSHSAVIELLLDHGALINAETTKGFTALHAASYQGQTECVEILIKRGANVMTGTTE